MIDVLPDSTQTQRLVRAEVLRGKFRNSFEKPEPFVPNQPTNIKFELNDVAHTFLKGHRIMIQIQSSWFPLVDRNPQQFLNIPTAKDEDFKKETITILHDDTHPSIYTGRCNGFEIMSCKIFYFQSHNTTFHSSNPSL